MSLLEKFKNKTVLVIGDVMVDSYLWGKVDRISPEAPVPVVAVKRRSNSLGGAANVALNLKALGARPVLCSVIGEDIKGREFLEMLKSQDLSAEGVIRSKDRITTTKFRVFGNNNQMLRVDEEITDDLTPGDEADFRETVINLIDNKKIDVVVFQDYDKGLLTKHIISVITEKCNSAGIPVAVDPKLRNFREYKNVALFKPNLKELREGLKMDIRIENSWELENAANMIHRDQKVEIVFTTLSSAGVFISSFDEDNQLVRHTIPAHIRSISDVSGAGDTVISVAALALASGMKPYNIAAVSNLAGGLVCEEVGVVPIDVEKFRAELDKLELE